MTPSELRERLQALKAAIGILADATVREKLDAIISALPEPPDSEPDCATCKRKTYEEWFESLPESPDSEPPEVRNEDYEEEKRRAEACYDDVLQFFKERDMERGRRK